MAKAAKAASWYVDERVMEDHGVSRRTARRWRAAGAPVEDAAGMAAWAESKRAGFKGMGVDVGLAAAVPVAAPPAPKVKPERAARCPDTSRQSGFAGARKSAGGSARRAPGAVVLPAPAPVAAIVMDRRDHQLAYILARTKLADEQADAQRMKNAERYGDLIAKDRHEAVIREHLLPVRDYLEDLPARFSSRANPTDPATAAAVLADVAKKLKELLRRDDIND
jgi:phage terminase Nu1 subunit (DNA packaging protein)